MQATPRLLYKGFWGRSLEELQRLTQIGMPNLSPFSPILPHGS